MDIKRECVLLLLLFLLLASGCSSSDVSQSTEPQASEPQAIQDQYVIGETTRAEVVSEWGEPTGRSVNEKQEEVITYNKSHITGKQFIPFYFGTDWYRVKIYTFSFNKDGILIGMSTEEH